MLELSNDSEVKGRNGWFKLNRFNLWDSQGGAQGHTLILDLLAARSGKNPPSTLVLTRGDARVVAEAILEILNTTDVYGEPLDTPQPKLEEVA